MTDIVERLRKWSVFGYGVEASADMKEAAAEIERLNDIIQNMRYAEDEDKNRCVVENELLRAALVMQLTEEPCSCLLSAVLGQRTAPSTRGGEEG